MNDLFGLVPLVDRRACAVKLVCPAGHLPTWSVP